MVVVPADLHIAKKGPQIIDVPQGVPREPRRSIQTTSWLHAQRGECNRQADSVAGDAGLVTGLHKTRIIAHLCLPLRAFF
jgi:hypothetical protein